MNATARTNLIEALRAGCTLPAARRSVGVTAAQVAAACVDDPKFEEKLREAQRRGKESPSAAAWQAVAQESAAPVIETSPPRVPSDEGHSDASVWARIRAEAAQLYGPGLYGLLLWQDDRLVTAGFPPMSPWWRWANGDFFRAFEEERKRWFIVLAGRGMGKSTTLTRLASLGATWCPRSIPPAQRWAWLFISVRPTDADRRMEEIQGIHHAAYGQDLEMSTPRGVLTMELDDAGGHPIAYNSLASTIGNVKGPSTIGVIFDEEAAMRKAGANPSGEILSSLIATFRARQGIFGIRCSSAWARDGSHWNAIQAGDTITNHVARIGPGFVRDAARGFLDVAAWEDSHGSSDIGDVLRRYAATLTPQTTAIPTWVGHPALGAVASRIDMEGVDDETLNELYPGLTRQGAWLREFGSVPPGGEDETDDTPYEVCGVPSRYEGDTAEDRDYG